MIEDSGRARQDAEHRALLGLLGAYADQELSEEVRQQVESHLLECAACRQELRTQLSVRARLAAEPGAVAPRALTERLASYVRMLREGPDAASADGLSGGRRARSLGRRVLRWPALVTWGGWLVAAGLAALLLIGLHRRPAGGMAMAMPNLSAVRVDSIPGPLAEAALQDFRRVNASDLPPGAGLKEVEARVPFSVPALRSPHMRLLGSWTTDFQGEPAAVLAYRCHNRLVIQYVVSERVFFRHPHVRQAIAAAGLYATGRGGVHAIGWPDLDSGSLLVGEFAPAELAAMRS